jgi:hypothetical protein
MKNSHLAWLDLCRNLDWGLSRDVGRDVGRNPGRAGSAALLIAAVMTGGCVTSGGTVSGLSMPSGLPSLSGFSFGASATSDDDTSSAENLTPAERLNQAAEDARNQYSMFQGAEREFRQQNPNTDTGNLRRELDAFNQQIDTLDGLADSISIA